jgi:hypothetical protein
MRWRLPPAPFQKTAPGRTGRRSPRPGERRPANRRARLPGRPGHGMVLGRSPGQLRRCPGVSGDPAAGPGRLAGRLLLPGPRYAAAGCCPRSRSRPRGYSAIHCPHRRGLPVAERGGATETREPSTSTHCQVSHITVPDGYRPVRRRTQHPGRAAPHDPDRHPLTAAMRIVRQLVTKRDGRVASNGSASASLAFVLTFGAPGGLNR